MGAAVGASLAGSAVSMWETQAQAKQEQESLKANEAYARQQAAESIEQGNRIAESQEIKGIEDSRRAMLADKRAMEKQRAMAASNGVSLDYGAPLQVAEMDTINANLNANDIFNAGLNQGAETRYASEQNARGLLYEAEQLKYKAELSKSTAKTAMLTGFIKAGAGAAMAGSSSSGTGSASSNFNNGSKGGWSASSSGTSW